MLCGPVCLSNVSQASSHVLGWMGDLSLLINKLLGTLVQTGCQETLNNQKQLLGLCSCYAFVYKTSVQGNIGNMPDLIKNRSVVSFDLQFTCSIHNGSAFSSEK